MIKKLRCRKIKDISSIISYMLHTCTDAQHNDVNYRYFLFLLFIFKQINRLFYVLITYELR